VVFLDQKLKNITNVVNELSNENQFTSKGFEYFTLPIIKHKVTFHFSAAIKYNILEKQFLQFATAALPQYLKKTDIQQRLGISSEEMEAMTNRLLKSQIIDVVDEEIRLKAMDDNCTLDKQLKTNKFSRTFDLYYEPITEFEIDNMASIALNSESKMHPVIVDDQYNFKNCAILSAETILESYARITGENLNNHFSNIMIDSIESEAEETNHKIELMEFELIDSVQQKVTKRLYNPDQHKLIELS